MNIRTLAVATAVALGAAIAPAAAKDIKLLNVSYDPTREFYKEYNAVFAAQWKAKTGDTVTVEQSHGGSGKQARAVIDGLAADVLTLALEGDIDQVATIGKKLPTDWVNKLPLHSSPYHSTIVFLVRKGNPKKIVDWDDLVKPGIQVITPNPKTSGGAQWNLLAAYAFANKKYGSEDKAKEFVSKLYRNVPVLDTGARGSTTTFVQRGIGDVLLAWENEAFLAIEELGPDKFQIVVPSLSILAEPTVAVVEKNAKSRGTTAVAQAYLENLYTAPAQKLIAKHYYRPAKPELVTAEDLKRFPKLTLVNIRDDFGGWTKARAKFFAEGAIFDQIYKPGR
ncbi:sulfate ABC transporter substrate-binding protein [Iodidimonas sp. SYSU 1G8]|uniref:sulfate ABC transporter substrate-binding protein n=1 Tax=Iodidimonas sp. SYSU 1G8 TaxID=3133967 RepID=UPI0031FF19DB